MRGEEYEAVRCRQAPTSGGPLKNPDSSDPFHCLIASGKPDNNTVSRLPEWTDNSPLQKGGQERAGETRRTCRSDYEHILPPGQARGAKFGRSAARTLPQVSRQAWEPRVPPAAHSPRTQSSDMAEARTSLRRTSAARGAGPLPLFSQQVPRRPPLSAPRVRPLLMVPVARRVARSLGAARVLRVGVNGGKS